MSETHVPGVGVFQPSSHAQGSPGEHQEVRDYLKVYASLMILLILTAWTAWLPLGLFNVFISLGIAIAKAVLIILVFMNVRNSLPILKIVVLAGFLWLGLLISLTMSDYFTRGMISIPGK